MKEFILSQELQNIFLIIKRGVIREKILADIATKTYLSLYMWHIGKLSRNDQFLKKL